MRVCVVAGLWATAWGTMAAGQTTGAGTKQAAPRVTAKDSVTVTAKPTPEEEAQGELEEAYQPVYQWKKPEDCDQIVGLCETKIIPKAEATKYEGPKGKFLFLANQDIAGCALRTGDYAKAETHYQKSLEYVAVWPGKGDSAYPQILVGLGAAYLGQEREADAAGALEKAIAIEDEMIQKAVNSSLEYERKEFSMHLRGDQLQAERLLAVARFKEGKQAEAMAILEKAYASAIENHVPAKDYRVVVETGIQAAKFMGDSAAQEKWEARNTAKN